jgi:acyl carrier protein phosphodiesterase
VKNGELMPYMIDQNWLLSYQTIEGINNILTQMDGRTKNKSKMRFATEELRSYTLNLRRTLQISLTI